MSPSTALQVVKIVHTLAWVFFAGCIVAIPFATYAGNFFASFVLIAIVLVEVLVLVVNRWRCPLTDVAARYTTDRRQLRHLPAAAAGPAQQAHLRLAVRRGARLYADCPGNLTNL